MIKLTKSLSVLYYLHVLAFLNYDSDEMHFPEKKICCQLYSLEKLLVIVDFTYENIFVIFKWACLDYIFSNKHGILHGRERREPNFPAGRHHPARTWVWAVWGGGACAGDPISRIWWQGFRWAPPLVLWTFHSLRRGKVKGGTTLVKLAVQV